jgi:hypothetical protein
MASNPLRRVISDLTSFCLLIVALSASSSVVQASETVKDKYRIAIGGYSLERFDNTMSLSEPTLGAGVFIDPESTLGLDTSQTVFRIDGHYRFTNVHALTYSWYSISALGNKTLTEDIDWIDENGNPITIPLGATVNTRLDYNIFKLGYLWSFYHNDKVELSFGGGLHLTRIAVNLRTSTTSSGIDAKDVSTSLPLPVISVGLTYHVNPKLSWYLKSELFAISIDDWQGTYTDSTLGLEYRITDHFALGAGLGSNALKIRQDTGDYTFRYENRITGLLLNAAFYF